MSYILFLAFSIFCAPFIAVTTMAALSLLTGTVTTLLELASGLDWLGDLGEKLLPVNMLVALGYTIYWVLTPRPWPWRALGIL